MRKFFLLSFLLTYSGLSALGQVDTGAIVGTIADGQQQRVADATIHLRQESTGIERNAKSAADGSFTFSPLAIGTYSLTVEHEGFDRYVQTGISITAQSSVRKDVALHVGSVTQTVEVAAGAALLETQGSTLQHLVSQRSINDLPLNGRNVAFLAQTAPGVTIAQADSRGLAASGSFSANGARRGQNDYLLDGIDNNAAIMDYVNQTQYVILPPPDALQEFVVQTTNYSAEFGHSAGAVLNVSTKSGGDAFHGDVWEFIRNDALDARNYFATAARKPAYRQNQFGFAFSGPVIVPKLYNGRGKTFFFFDYQGTRIAQGASKVSTVPTIAERTSGFTNFADLVALQSGTKTDALGRTFPVGTIFDPATTRATTANVLDATTGLKASSSGYVRDPFYAGTVGNQTNFTTAMQLALLNRLPVTRLNTNAIALLNLFPSPSAGGITNNYTSFPSQTNNSDGIDLRLDQHFGDRDSAFVRYSYLNTDQVNPRPFQGIADGQSSRPGNGATQAQNIALSETHIFNPSLVNEARFGYSRVVDIRRQLFANQLGIPAQYGIGGIPQFPGNGGLPTLTFGSLSNLGQPGSLPSNKASDITQLSDNVTSSHGHHVVRAGVLWQNIFYPTSTPSSARGSFGFSGIYTSVVNQTDPTTDRAQFLLNPSTDAISPAYNNIGGANSVGASSFPPISNLRRTYLGLYVQDDWRATSRLTVNVGLRWEHYGVPTERNNRQANFLPGPGNPAVGAQFLIPMSQVAAVPQAFLNLLAKDNIAFVPTSNSGLGVAQKQNFAPRFGVAYQLNSRTVIHAGVGLFYGGYENYGLSAMPAANFPFNIATSYSAANAVTPLTPSNSVGTLSNGLTNVPLSASNANLTNISLLGRAYNWKSAYTESFNAQLQYQLTQTTVLKIAYAGSVSRHLQSTVGSNTLNTILPASSNAQTNSFFPDFARGGSFVIPSAATNYNGLQLDVTRRWQHDLTVDANYTYSKCLGNARDILDNNIGSYRAPYVPGVGIGADYALCDIDVRNIFHASGTYALPFGHGQALLTRGVASHIAGGWSLQGIATVQDGQPFTVACTTTTTAGLGCNALKVAGQNPYAGPHNATQFLNPAAFANPSSAATGIAALDSMESRRSFLKGTVAAAVAAAAPVAAEVQRKRSTAKPSTPPNIILYLADQFRWDFVGANGRNSSTRTPNIDALAARGKNFTQTVTNQPVCAPARSVLFTSRYATETGVWHNGLPLDKSLPTLAGELRKAGYSANLIGKWHLALGRAADGGSAGPVKAEDRGGFLDLWEGANAIENTSHPYEGTIWDRDNKEISYKDEYRVDFLTDRAERFLRQKQDKPFFLFISQLEPHQQNDMHQPIAPKGAAARFLNATVPDDLRAQPGFWQSQLPDYYGCIEAIDASVGRVRKILEEEHLAENTIFVFISDHGCHFGTRNQEYKRSTHNSSIRVPLIIDGPGFRGTQQIPELVGLIDVAPTLLEAAGVPVPSTWKGHSVLPLLNDPEARQHWPNQQLIQISESMTGRAIRTPDWTYCVADISGAKEAAAKTYTEYQIYDQRADPNELVNLAGRKEYRIKADELRDQLKSLLVAAGEPEPEIVPAKLYP